MYIYIYIYIHTHIYIYIYKNDFRDSVDKKFDVSSYLIISYTRAVAKRGGEGGGGQGEIGKHKIFICKEHI